MPGMTREDRLIHLEKMTNTRDIGGYKTDKGYLKAKRFVRGSAPNGASNKDLKTLYDYGVRVAVDLRSDSERQSRPSRLKGYKDIKTYEVNLLNQAEVNVIPANISSLSRMLIETIENCKPMIKDLFEIFMAHSNECIFYYCSAGKDRTGVTTALILHLAGCSDEDIAQDYSESYENNKAMMASLTQMMPPGMERHLRSDPEMMIGFLDYLEETYSDAKGYLMSIGIKEKVLDEFKAGLSE